MPSRISQPLNKNPAKYKMSPIAITTIDFIYLSGEPFSRRSLFSGYLKSAAVPGASSTVER
jgi:hypothetical protein